MVETTLHPRPCFHTFLHADSTTGGDALTYYDYQRALRAKKVEILQQRRAATYEPGFKKPCAVHPAKITRKVFQMHKLPVSTPTPKPAMESLQPVHDRSALVENVTSVGSAARMDALEPTAVEQSQNNTSIRANFAEKTQTEKLPKIARLIKSATARPCGSSGIVSPPLIPQRPKTVASTRDRQVQTSLTQGALEKIHRRADVGVAERGELCRSYQWGTSTQRNFDKVKWTPRLSLPAAFLPTTTVEQFPDAVSQKLTFRRYNSEPAGWQPIFFGMINRVVVAAARVFSRFLDMRESGIAVPANLEMFFYRGYIPGLGAYDAERNVGIAPMGVVRTTQPRKTTISRRANIPGYAGQVHWTTTAPAHSDMPIPEPTSTARVHRYIPLENELSPFQREGMMSRMITTVSPYNPFNKIQY